MDKFRLWLGERLAGYREWIEGRNPFRFELVLLTCVVVGITVIIGTAYLPALGGFSAGQPAPHAVTANESVVVVDSAATEALRTQVADLVQPVYVPDPEALDAAIADLKGFFAQVDRVRQDFGSDRAAPDPALLEQAVQEIRLVAPETVSDPTLVYLLTADPPDYRTIQTQAAGALRTVFTYPITEETMEGTRARARSMAEALAGSSAGADAIYEVTAGSIRPNQVVDEQQTEARRRAAVQEVAPVTMTVREGQLIVAEGEVVTEQNLLILQALNVTQGRSGWKIWVGSLFFALLVAVVFSRLLHRFNKSTGLENIMLLALTLLLLFFTLAARLLIIHPLSGYLIPVAAIGMVVTIILNARSAFLMVVLLSLNVGLLVDLDMRYVVVAIIAGAFSVYLVTRVVQRAALLGAGVATAFLAAFTIFSVEFFRQAGIDVALRAATWGVAHGILAWVLTMLLLLLMDTVFNLNTPLRLLELANPAHPLLKRLLQVAPGTYNHSIQMGNMAEAAAEAIDADPLLARVGAYYHDIGKTIRPEYFSENQKTENVDNPHDRLSPNLSKLALAAHVRDGEHLAKVYGLPAPVIDIIRQHHGTTVMAFFYNKARDTSSRARVEEEDYRYEEERPRTKEAAIIMLADATEAAVRALPNPTRRKIQGVIQEIFKQKIEDGQLDDSELTLADLRKIREAFDMNLRGMIGQRVPYPERSPRERGQPQPAPADAREHPPIVATSEVEPLLPVVSARPRVPPSAAALRSRETTAANRRRAVPERPGPAPESSESADHGPDGGAGPQAEGRDHGEGRDLDAS